MPHWKAWVWRSKLEETITIARCRSRSVCLPELPHPNVRSHTRMLIGNMTSLAHKVRLDRQVAERGGRRQVNSQAISTISEATSSIHTSGSVAFMSLVHFLVVIRVTQRLVRRRKNADRNCTPCWRIRIYRGEISDTYVGNIRRISPVGQQIRNPVIAVIVVLCYPNVVISDGSSPRAVEHVAHEPLSFKLVHRGEPSN